MPESDRPFSTVRSAFGRTAIAAIAAGLLSTASVGDPALGQDQPAAVPDSQLVDDFNHYVNIANIELARATAQALLDRQIAPGAFMGIIEDSATMQERFERAYRRALQVPELEDLAAKLYRLYDDGRLERARDPNEIARNIAMLTGNPRAQILARQRLSHAGEYAVPQLLEVILARNDQALQAEVTQLLTSMGRQSVQPLCAALANVDPVTQESLARILGRIQYRSALPYLSELYHASSSAAVKTAAAEAIKALGGAPEEGASISAQFADLAEQYYAEPRSLTSFPGEEHQLLWAFEPRMGLQPTAIRTEVYHEARAMELTERALTLDPRDQHAISLWLAANFSREIDQPEGYDNPAYPTAARREPMYYAVAAGPVADQQVLARALADRDTKLALRAIGALSQSAGASGLASTSGGPLVESLSYPDRRVRYEAALAIGRANPRSAFEGSERVVPVLASVIREANKRYALVLADDLERQQVLRKVIESLGYTSLPPARTLSESLASIADVPGVDVIVTDLGAGTTLETIDQARRTARLQATPLLALMSGPALNQYTAQFEGDSLTRLLRQGVTDDQVGKSVADAVEHASGAPISDEEAARFADRSLSVLHDLALGSPGGGQVLDVADAAAPLMAALHDSTGPVRLKIADVLSYIGQQRVQVALMDSAMDATGQDRLDLLHRVIDSAKRYGNLLQDRHVRWLVTTADSATGDEATAAAALMGALNLPNEKLVPLILGRSQ